MTDFDTNPDRQADTFLLGELTESQKSQGWNRTNLDRVVERACGQFLTGAAVRAKVPLRG